MDEGFFGFWVKEEWGCIVNIVFVVVKFVFVWCLIYGVSKGEFWFFISNINIILMCYVVIVLGISSGIVDFFGFYGIWVNFVSFVVVVFFFMGFDWIVSFFVLYVYVCYRLIWL